MHGVATMESGRLVVASGLDHGIGSHIQSLTGILFRSIMIWEFSSESGVLGSINVAPLSIFGEKLAFSGSFVLLDESIGAHTHHGDSYGMSC